MPPSTPSPISRLYNRLATVTHLPSRSAARDLLFTRLQRGQSRRKSPTTRHSETCHLNQRRLVNISHPIRRHRVSLRPLAIPPQTRHILRRMLVHNLQSIQIDDEQSPFR